MHPANSTWLPAAFTEWQPWLQALTLGLATWVQEDLPTLTAALLASAGQLNWRTGFIGCFLGIWLGDALLYGLARGAGRPLLRWAWVRRWVSPEAIERSERWFATQGTWLLISSRFVPGTRLPTYLAAGFLRLPFTRFLAITGVVVALWTGALFGLAQIFGPQLQVGWQRWNRSGWIVLAFALVVVVFLRYLPRWVQPAFWRRKWVAIERWRHWEFWPAGLFYVPVALNYLRLAWKYGGLTVPSAANPGIATGGLVGESKFGTLQALQATSPEFTAESWLLEADPRSTGAEKRSDSRLETLLRLCAEHHVEFPLILKPDVGQRGAGVRLIRNAAEADAYLTQTSAAVVLQRYVPGPFEVGVFYYRLPHETRGRIFALTEKVFPVITGDGSRTIEELIWADSRARYVAERYLERFAARRHEVLAAGATLRLVEAGNHAQGCIFRDGAHLGTPELEATLDRISRQLPGFFVGRYDLRFASTEDLRAGRNFQILELNGASAEATSIYDARNSLRSAYRTLFRQWEIVFAIGAANRTRGSVPIAPLTLLRLWRQANALITSYPMAD